MSLITNSKESGWVKVRFESEDQLKRQILKCEGKHIQQVSYSTYHKAFTQVCFGCKRVRTTLEFQG